MMRSDLKSQQGFTLIEMIMVIVITGIIGGIVAVFIRAPVQGYMDSARRAEISDVADTALRRLGRDLRTAVPNSVRVAGCGATPCVEFLPTKTGGRYRVDPANGLGGCSAVANNTLGDALNFDAADACFEVVGSQIALVRGAADDLSDQIVIGSTQSNGNMPYDNTVSGVRRSYTGATGTQTAIQITNVQFPASADLPGHRFEVVPGDQQAVTYACLNASGVDGNGDGAGTLTRYWTYGFNNPQVEPALLGGMNAILADKVSACNFVYDTSNQRNGLVAVSLTITRSNESVSLYHEIHMNNIP